MTARKENALTPQERGRLGGRPRNPHSWAELLQMEAKQAATEPPRARPRQRKGGDADQRKTTEVLLF